MVGAARLSCWPRPASAKIILSVERSVARSFACSHIGFDRRRFDCNSLRVELFCLIYD
jgi:hypothetical protein